MGNNELLYFQGLCSRLKSNGFSWQHEDYIMLREILPKMGNTIEELESKLSETQRVNDEYKALLIKKDDGDVLVPLADLEYANNLIAEQGREIEALQAKLKETQEPQ